MCVPFICSLVWRSRPRTEREGFVGVVGLSSSVFTGLLSFAVGLLEFCNKQLTLLQNTVRTGEV